MTGFPLRRSTAGLLAGLLALAPASAAGWVAESRVDWVEVIENGEAELTVSDDGAENGRFALRIPGLALRCQGEWRPSGTGQRGDRRFGKYFGYCQNGYFIMGRYEATAGSGPPSGVGDGADSIGRPIRLTFGRAIAGTFRPTPQAMPGRAARSELPAGEAGTRAAPADPAVVREVQSALLDQGLDPGPVDGVAGPRTQSAIRQFQQRVGLPLDGAITDTLIASLRAATAFAGDPLMAPSPPEAPVAFGDPSRVATGFAVDGGRHVVTSRRVIDACARPEVLTAGGVPHRAEAREEVGDDLALLRMLEPLDADAAIDAGAALPPGSAVFVVGLPHDDRRAASATVTTGTVAAPAGAGGDARYRMIAAPIQAGHGGGPLLDEGGNVVGAVVGVADAAPIAAAAGSPPPDAGLALVASALAGFLDASGVGYRAAGAARKMAAEELAERAISFTVAVTCRY